MCPSQMHWVWVSCVDNWKIAELGRHLAGGPHVASVLVDGSPRRRNGSVVDK